jgi:hypothetical protein
VLTRNKRFEKAIRPLLIISSIMPFMKLFGAGATLYKLVSFDKKLDG